MKRFLLLAVVLMTAVAVQAQTTVTGTVVDQDGVTWANGTYTVQYTAPPGFPGSLTNTATMRPVNPAILSGALDGTGSFSLNLIPSLSVMSQNGSIPGVVFKVCPQMKWGGCFSTPIIFIPTSPSTLDVSAQITAAIPAAALRLTSTGPQSQAYADVEVASVTGSQYFRLSDKTFRCYTTSWGGCGGSIPGVTPDGQTTPGISVAGTVAAQNALFGSSPVATPQGVDSVVIATAGSGQTSGIYWAVANYGGAIISYHVASGALDDVRVIRPGGPYAQPPTFTIAAGGTPGTVTASLAPGSNYRIRQVGDSLTVGTGGYNTTPIPALVSQFTGYQAINQGIWGNTAPQICVRTGACSVAATVTGGTVPACASVPCSTGTAVTFTSGSEPVTSLGPFAGVPGTLVNGGTSVHGTVSYNGSYTFTPSDVGSSVTMSSATFTADPIYNDAAEIVWAGRNDVTQALTEAPMLASVASMCGNRSNTNVPCLVLGITTQMTPGEATGGANATIINQWNNDLGTARGTCTTPYTSGCGFLNIDSILKANADKTNPVDVADVANGWIPASMRSNTLVATLNGSIIATGCPTLTITTGTLSAGTVLVISDGANSEEIFAATVAGSVVSTCTRNFNSSSVGAQSHTSGLTVTGYDSLHLGNIAQSIIARNEYQWLSSHWAPAMTAGTAPQRNNSSTTYAQHIIGNNPLLISGTMSATPGAHASWDEVVGAGSQGNWSTPYLVQLNGGILIPNNTAQITIGNPGSQVTLSSNAGNLIFTGNLSMTGALNVTGGGSYSGSLSVLGQITQTVTGTSLTNTFKSTTSHSFTEYQKGVTASVAGTILDDGTTRKWSFALWNDDNASIYDNVTSREVLSFPSNTMPANSISGNANGPILLVMQVPSARKGTFTCTAGGTITISNTNEAITSDVIISLNTAGGTITTSPAMKTVTAGTGFTVLCGASDTSVYNYDILN